MRRGSYAMSYMQVLENLTKNGVIPEARMRVLKFGNSREPRIIDLLNKGHATEDQIMQAGVGVDNLDNPIVIATDLVPDQDALLLLKSDIARRESVLPYQILHDDKIIRMVIPLRRINDIQLKDDMQAQAYNGYKVEFYLSSEEEIKKSVDRAYRAEGEIHKIVSKQNAEEAKKVETTIVEDIVEESPEIKFVDLILDQAINDRASDIHIEQTDTKVIVRFRLDGVLKDISDNTPKVMAAGIISRIKIMANMDIAERRKPQDGRLSRVHPKRGKIDFRVAILPTVTGEKIVMRLLDNSQAALKLSDLGFSTENKRRFEEAYTRPHGLILVTGPTGSGKSTTLYAALNALVNPGINIITVEDPVEYRMERVNQVQVHPKAGLTFAGALRSILRSDPDVLLIGEIRDAETAKIAVEAAQTGHLVLTTLHTNDAPSAVGRLVDLGVEPFLVGTTVEAVLAQRLIRRICTNCKEAYTPDVEDLKHVGFNLWVEGTPLPTLYRGVGCKECLGIGYKGRVAVHEVMSATPAIQKMIIRGADSVDLQEKARQEGMATLREDGWLKVSQGLTTIEEVLKIT